MVRFQHRDRPVESVVVKRPGRLEEENIKPYSISAMRSNGKHLKVQRVPPFDDVS